MSSRQITETPKRYQRGLPLRAKQLNQLQQGIVRLNGGANPPLQLVGQATGVNKIAIGRFVITSIAEDYLVCREFDGTQQGEVDVYIAKPPLLRNSVVARAGITYTYSAVDTRTADDGAATEDQVIVPSYTVDDEIYAMRGINRGSGVFSDPNSTQKIEWLDLNLDARAWAAVGV